VKLQQMIGRTSRWWLPANRSDGFRPLLALVKSVQCIPPAAANIFARLEGFTPIPHDPPVAPSGLGCMKRLALTPSHAVPWKAIRQSRCHHLKKNILKCDLHLNIITNIRADGRDGAACRS